MDERKEIRGDEIEDLERDEAYRFQPEPEPLTDEELEKWAENYIRGDGPSLKEMLGGTDDYGIAW